MKKLLLCGFLALLSGCGSSDTTVIVALSGEVTGAFGAGTACAEVIYDADRWHCPVSCSLIYEGCSGTPIDSLGMFDVDILIDIPDPPNSEPRGLTWTHFEKSENEIVPGEVISKSELEDLGDNTFKVTVTATFDFGSSP